MQSSPNTDKTFGIASAEKFRDVRERSKKQEIERKMRRDRKQEFQPRFNIDDRVVITNMSWRTKDKHYQYVQIVDIEHSRGCQGIFDYYGIVLKVTDQKKAPRLGHLTKFSENKKGWSFESVYANVKDDGTIKWVATLEV
jgi:hypothetical protein